ncbi:MULTISPECIES: S41 family peptidase [Flavobacterium]|uniref:S41 family peptidase n=1 Tax=Flavobacterium jumunjinense TaxID=998845 RepID=A0ABV5GS00_9FLAO|nr:MULTISPECIES: S41 family peptidase [Flavobacterium]
MIKNYIYLLILLIFTACTKKNAIKLVPEVKEYLDEVITILEHNSVNKYNIEWYAFKNEVYTHASKAKTIEEAYPSITFAISKLNDKHSYFAPNITSEIEVEKKELPILKDEIVPNSIGYIRIPFCIGDEQTIQTYIQNITNKIKTQDSPMIKGWIVDLRGNFGGNMWPMLTAIGPILGNGKIGYFINAENKSSTWKYENGKVYLENTIVEETKNAYHLIKKEPYVAILIDTITASSGEAITVAFKNRKSTRFFGEPTFGVSTGNKSYTLSDGSRINLTESVFADRNKNKYGKSIFPDEECKSSEAINKAIKWFNKIDIQ